MSERATVVDDLWTALGHQQEWLNKPELVEPDPIWKMTVKEGFGCFDDAFWRVFQSFPFQVCHVSYSGAPWSREGGPPSMVLRFTLLPASALSSPSEAE